MLKTLSHLFFCMLEGSKKGLHKADTHFLFAFWGIHKAIEHYCAVVRFVDDVVIDEGAAHKIVLQLPQSAGFEYLVAI